METRMSRNYAELDLYDKLLRFVYSHQQSKSKFYYYSVSKKVRLMFTFLVRSNLIPLQYQYRIRFQQYVIHFRHTENSRSHLYYIDMLGVSCCLYSLLFFHIRNRCLIGHLNSKSESNRCSPDSIPSKVYDFSIISYE